jgi:acyl carrier protein phosphodiesterase
MLFWKMFFFSLCSPEGRRIGDRFVNFLTHLFLSNGVPELLVGNLMGDFVKGRLDGRFPPGIKQGILLHREIDSFTGQNCHFLCSKRRLDQSFGHYRGVLVDLFYDHFLAANWEDYADVPYSVFISDAYRVLYEHKEFLPAKLQRIMPYIFRDWLPSYRTIGGIAAVLHRMSHFRLKRVNRLGEGAEALSRHYGGIYGDFRKFLPELIAFSGSKVIVAINKDKEENIFNVDHFGIVGDYKEVVPALTTKLKELKSK